MTIKLPMQHSQIEEIALNLRLEQLGVTVKPDRTIDPVSLAGVEGGAEAVQRLLGKDGVLDLAAAAQLRRAKNAVGLGAPATPELATQVTTATRAVTLELQGLVGHLRRLSNAEAPTKEELDGLAKRASNVHGSMQRLFPQLGLADPEVVSALAAAASDLPAASRDVMAGLSEHRIKWLDDPSKRKEIIASLRASIEILGPLQLNARMYTEPAWKMLGTNQVANEILGWLSQQPAPQMPFGQMGWAESFPGQQASNEALAQAQQAHSEALVQTQQAAIVRAIDRIERETGLPRGTIATGLATFTRPEMQTDYLRLAQMLRYLEGTLRPQAATPSGRPVELEEAKLLASVVPIPMGLFGNAFAL
ncbi:MAG: hypothetical protein IT384_26295 [Deltaproteobacteria bacterium]|nr:hypothetical protein [Deltaproteobacteria bacterium]